MKIENISIKYSYIIILVFVLTPLYVFYSWYNYNSAKKEIIYKSEFSIAQSKNNIKNLISLTEKSYELVSESYHDMMISALYDFKSEYEKTGDIESVDIEKLKVTYNKKLDFYILSKEGVIERATFAPAVGLDFGKVPEFYAYIEKVLDGNSVEISKVTTDLKTKELRKWGYIPTDDKQWLLEVGLDAKELSQYISKIDYKKLESEIKNLNPYIKSIRVFDWNKIALGFPNEEITEETKQLIVKLLQEKQDYRIIRDDDLIATDYFFISTFSHQSHELEDTNKIIQISYDNSLIEEQLYGLTNQSVIAFFFLVFISYIVIYFSTKNFITMPLIELSHAIKEFDLERKAINIPVSGRNEISTLIQSFNNLSRKLIDSTISKNKFENILDSVGDIVIITDLNLNINQINRHGRVELVISEKEYVNKNISLILESDEDVSLLIFELHNNNLIKDREICFISSESKKIFTMATFSKIFDAEGKVVGYICNAKNITSTKKKIKQLNKENKKLQSKGLILEERSRKDFLTKIYNRFHMDKVLLKAVDDGKNTGRSSFVLMLDIDKFKEINDNFGHQKGDEVLIKVSEVIAGSIRSSDVPCRFGGEEFLVLLTNTSEEGATMVSEKIRQHVENVIFTDDLKVTISGGLACWDEDSIEEIIKRADTCLYKAKKAGRNRILSDF